MNIRISADHGVAHAPARTISNISCVYADWNLLSVEKGVRANCHATVAEWRCGCSGACALREAPRKLVAF